jgi:hypothetical protein
MKGITSTATLRSGFAALFAACGGVVDPPVDTPVVDPPEDDPPVAGEVALYPRHRLNAEEYRRSVLAVLGVEAPVVESFPEDPEASGFRNIGTALSVSPERVEYWVASAADVAARSVRGNLAREGGALLRLEAEHAGWAEAIEGRPSTFEHLGSSWMAWWDAAPRRISFEITEAGSYRIDLLAYAPSGQRPQLALSLDGEALQTVEIVSDPDVSQLVSWEQELSPGAHEVVFVFVQGGPVPGHLPPPTAQNLTVPTLAIDRIDLTGPVSTGPGVPARSRLVACDPEVRGVEVCATEVLADVALRAWRRPVTEAEVGGLVALVVEAVSEGLQFEDGLVYALQAVFASPHFLFRLETHPEEVVFGEVEHPRPAAADPLEAYEVAARLSYYAWSAPPDEALLACAASGALLDPTSADCALGVQLDRMLADPRSEALTRQWIDQWLNLRELDHIHKVWLLFPWFNQEIADLMREELWWVARELIDGDQPLPDVLDQRWTWVDQRLAAYYGVQGPTGAARTFQRVELDGVQRGGLLTMGGVLALTSPEHRTSPTKRATWILDAVLCTAMSPPEFEVPRITPEQTNAGLESALAAHDQPLCRGCHDVLDPLGLPLEHFDATGRWRDTNPNGSEIVIDVQLPDGTPLGDALDLGAALKDDPDLDLCLVSKVAAYATGLDLGSHTASERRAAEEALYQVIDVAGPAGLSYRDVIDALVVHPLFTHRPPLEAP